MKTMNKFIKYGLSFVFLFLIVVPVHAGQRQLTPSQIERVKAAKALLNGVDGLSLTKSISELENNPSPEGNLQILEAVAKTYDELITEQNVDGLAKKQWLYSMVQLNMAYFQFSGGQTQKKASTTNQLIQRKLKRHLPPEIYSNSAIFHSID